MRVGREDSLAERVERELRARRRKAGALALVVRQHLLGREKDELAAGGIDCRAGELEARDLSVRIREFDFRESGLRLPRQHARYGVCDEFRILAGDELGERLAGEFGGRHPDERRESGVHGFDSFAVQERRLAQSREHREHGVAARLHDRRGRSGIPQASDFLPQSPGEDRKDSGKHRQRHGGDHRDRHLACHPLRIRGLRDRQFRYIARPLAAYPTLVLRPAAIHHNGTAMNAKTEAARRQMIDQQVRTWDVLDASVLDALGAIPREKFVPAAYRGVAFADAPVPIGHGQFMLPPALEGRILQALVPVRGERALEIGTGSGFFAACLAHLTGSVDSIEIHADLAAGAARAIGEQGISRISIETGDAFARELDDAYEVVAITGALPAPEPRFERALVVGGRMFVVIGVAPVMEARLVTRTGEDSWLSETLFETRIEPLVQPVAPSRFRF